MGFYSEQIVPRITHYTLRVGAISKLRAEQLLQTSGIVLDVGFGSGLNVPHYPDSVTKVMAVEPSKVARKIAQPLIATAKFPVQFAGLDGQRLDVASESVDFVVTTWTLCTIPDPAIALNEFARVLKPGGKFLFVEHGLSPDESIMRWQNRLNRLQITLAGGCHLNRDIEQLVSSSPFKITSLRKFYFSGPRTHAYFYAGVAIKI
jgi:ubiquinone/menaquinone biosynthesis C-methylase UbiE